MGFGVVSSDLTFWSGLCLRKDEILLWVLSGFLDIEGPKDSNECKKLMCLLPVNPQCSEGLRVINGKGRGSLQVGPHLVSGPHG